MIKRKPLERRAVKEHIVHALREEHAFWSYDPHSVTTDSISDDQLIALTMRHLDLKEIDMLFEIYSKDRIKAVWRRQLVPEGDYLYTLNRFFAWYYFNSKNPDAYLKSLETRRLNQIAMS